MTTATDTQITDTVRLTVLKYLAGGRDKEFAAIASGLTEDQVLDIASRHGWPDLDKIAWAVDVLAKQVETGTDIPKSRRLEEGAPLATGGFVTPPRPTSINVATTPPPAAPVGPATDRLGHAIGTARSSGVKKLIRLADRLEEARDALLSEVTAYDAKAEERKAAEREKAANAARIAELKAELAKLQTTTKTNRAGRATPNTGSAKAIRQWAREQGIEVASIGRVPVHVIDAYAQAHPAA